MGRGASLVVSGQVLCGGGEPHHRVFLAARGGLWRFGVRVVCAGDGVLNLVWPAAVDIAVTALRMLCRGGCA